MGVLIGESTVTDLSYFEYQAIVLCLAGTICVGMIGIEITMNRFQMLPIIFPGVFSVRERRFYFYEVDVTNGAVAEKLRSHAKMLIRMTLIVVMSYLWQHCVISTETIVGLEFPKEQCDKGYDCFASEVHLMTFFNRNSQPVDCKGPEEDFEKRYVVSCINFVEPTASGWLMHVGIAHSLTQLNVKFYGLLIWAGGNSRCTNRLFALFGITSLILAIVLYISGVFSEVATSWLSFVTTMSVPVFLYNVNRSASILHRLWKDESLRLQGSIEQHLSMALEDMELSEKSATGNTNASQPSGRGRVREALHNMRTRTLAVGRIAMLRGARSSSDTQNAGEGEVSEPELPDKQ